MYRGAVNKFSYLNSRLLIFLLLSIILIISDGKFNMLSTFKNHVTNFVSLFYRLCYETIYVYKHISKILEGYVSLVLENEILYKQLCLKNSELLIMEHYKQENRELHNLLSSSICKTNRKLITPIFVINANMNTEEAIINKGKNNDIYVGQPVISDVGVVGQVMSVTNTNSRILLISDRAHALSVKLQRNNTHMILIGRGHNFDLQSEFFGDINDIHVNDMLVTSGLDGRFPEGYPVAIVSKINNNSETDFTIIQAKPIVAFQNLRYVILIWD